MTQALFFLHLVWLTHPKRGYAKSVTYRHLGITQKRRLVQPHLGGQETKRRRRGLSDRKFVLIFGYSVYGRKATILVIHRLDKGSQNRTLGVPGHAAQTRFVADARTSSGVSDKDVMILYDAGMAPRPQAFGRVLRTRRAIRPWQAHGRICLFVSQGEGSAGIEFVKSCANGERIC